MTAASADNAPLIRIEQVNRTYTKADGATVPALVDITDRIDRGEVLVVIGPSGSGKSTLLRALNGLEPVDSGRIVIDGEDITRRGTDLDRVRAEVGMVFQHFNLFPHKTVLENVTLPQMVVRRRGRETAEAAARRLLERVGVADKAVVYPSRLSGGEQQRVAIARALAMDPKVMLFDEVTSALDPEAIGGVLRLMEQLAAEGMTMAVVTHEMGFARRAAHRLVFMAAGEVVEQGLPERVFTAPEQPRTRDFLNEIL
jgi:polar amino acid transport system ATP-binding protein